MRSTLRVSLMQDVICSTPYHVGNIARREGRCDEVKRAAFDDFEVKPDVHKTRDYDYVDRCGRFRGQSEHVAPSTVGQGGVRKYEVHGVATREFQGGSLTTVSAAGLDGLVSKSQFQRVQRLRLVVH